MRISCLLGMLLLSLAGTAQRADYPKVIPALPEAAALGKYGDIPVSTFTGVPQVSIPVWKYSVGDIAVDVGLNYHAGGIKVDELATNVGLGWTLNAGGMVAQTVMGLPDGINSVYPADEVNFNPYASLGSTLPDDYYFAMDAINNNRDLERDIYSFNFMGQSGKFYFDKQNKARLVPANPAIRITRINGAQSLFLITDDKGFQYYFTALEQSSYNYSCITGTMGGREYSGVLQPTAFLEKIVSPNGSTVRFDYESYNYTYDQNMEEASYQKTVPCSGGLPLDRLCKRVVTVNGLRVKRIYADDNPSQVVFNYSVAKRQDLLYNGQQAGNYLEGIDIYNNTGIVKRWNFTYGYFGTGTGNTSRLKLLTAKEDSKPTYVFTYDETNPLPERLSFSQDEWGYYNGKSNGSLIPPAISQGKPYGADRSADFQYMKSGTLTKLQYPTGGYTMFTYEPHIDNVTYTVTELGYGGGGVSLDPNDPNAPLANDFVADGGTVTLEWLLQPFNYDDYLAFTLFDVTDNTGVRGGNGQGSQQLTLITGHTYRISIGRTHINDYGYAHVFWPKPITHTVTGPKIVYGGLRIRSLKSYDQSGKQADSKFYNYNFLNNPNRSSIIYPPSGGYAEVYQPPSNGCPYYIYSSSAQTRAGGALNNTMGYTEVTEMSAEDGSNGRTVYKYSGGIGDVGLTDPVYSASSEWYAGMLLEKRVSAFNSSNNTFRDIACTKNYYQAIYDWGCYQAGNTNCNPNQNLIANFQLSFSKVDEGWTSPAQFIVDKYYTISVPVFMTRTDEITYDATGTNALTKTTSYTYGSNKHFYPTVTQTTNSSNETVRQENKYAFDFSGTAVYDAMIDRNIIAPLIEQKTYNNNQLMASTFTRYNFWNGVTQVKPQEVLVARLNNPYDRMILYNGYDTKGNIISFTQRDGALNSYLWGYNQAYAVAEVRNVLPGNVAYTSFEGDKGGWTYAGVSVTDNTAITGKSVYNLVNGSISSSTGILDASKNYWLTVWAKSQPTVSGGTLMPAITRTTGSWKLYVFSIPSGTTTVSVSGNTTIDELRLYPKDAFMNTFSYDPLVGITSKCDMANNVLYYVYDAFGRLKQIKDADGNIVSMTEYQYKQVQ